MFIPWPDLAPHFLVLSKNNNEGKHLMQEIIIRRESVSILHPR